MKKACIVFLALFMVFQLCLGQKNPKIHSSKIETAVKMADSEMKQFPEPWSVDFNPKPVWNYTQGLVAFAMIKLWKESGNESYYNYAKTYADKFIDQNDLIGE